MLFRIKLWLLGAGAVVAALFGMYLKIQADARTIARNRQTEELLGAVKQHKGIRDVAKTLSDAELDRRNAKWLRDTSTSD